MNVPFRPHYTADSLNRGSLLSQLLPPGPSIFNIQVLCGTSSHPRGREPIGGEVELVQALGMVFAVDIAFRNVHVCAFGMERELVVVLGGTDPKDVPIRDLEGDLDVGWLEEKRG
jgi:hypothetical protein